MVVTITTKRMYLKDMMSISFDVFVGRLQMMAIFGRNM
jgi:hypothetical protein